jgi:pimeloyl-ACP methyl ester carboxylesterase
MFKRTSIILFALLMIGVVVFDPFTVRPASFTSEGQNLKIGLSRGDFTVFDFPSKKPTTTALLLFGSGDGGWSALEEDIARTFQGQGYEVIGIDYHAYAQSDYDLEILQSDYSAIARKVLARFGDRPPPLIVGGYSMGAAQAIAVAGGPHPPLGLIGLLVIDPLSRGRYGLRASDQMNVLPNGPGTFAVGAFTNSMGSLRVVQWHAEKDLIDSRDWLDSLTARHHLFIFPSTGHFYNTNTGDFLRQLVESVGWIVDPTQAGPEAEKTTAIP